YRRLARGRGALVPLLVGAAWTAAELARAKVAGNPWALLGYSQTPVPLLVQGADLAGVFGIGFAIAAVNGAIAACWRARVAGGDVAGARAGIAVAGLVVAAMLGYGVVAERALAAHAGEHTVPVSVAQANLDLGTQWKSEFYGANLGAYAELTLQATTQRPARLVV